MAAHPTPIAPSPRAVAGTRAHPDPVPRFASFVGGGLAPSAGGRGVTLTASIAMHVVLIAVAFILPLFSEDILPMPGESLRAFFVAPPQVAPPPPPPPPPAPAAARALRRAPPVARPPSESARFVAPVEVPEELPPPEETLDLGGIEGGVPGGVEGGVPGGVVGGIVGGLPGGPVAPPPLEVRVGGKITAPKLAHVVQPEYPPLARQARLRGVVLLEARVGTDGRVRTVRALRGPPLLIDSAIAAVSQWRYQPLLLNGVPVQFILNVTIVFNLEEAVPQ